MLAASGNGHVVRTAWLYGAGGSELRQDDGELAGEHETVSVVADQLGQPTWTGDLAVRIVELPTPTRRRRLPRDELWPRAGTTSPARSSLCSA